MSNTPVTIDLPHRLGTTEAKRRIGGNIHLLAGRLPAGTQVRSAWEGDTMALGIGLLGQEIDARLDVGEAVVRVTVALPGALAFFGKAIEAGLKQSGAELLEDRRP